MREKSYRKFQQVKGWYAPVFTCSVYRLREHGPSTWMSKMTSMSNGRIDGASTRAREHE